MDELRFESRILHPEVQSIQREKVQESLKEARTTDAQYTKYEYTCLVGTRAQQIADGARPLISLDGIVTSDPLFVWTVAEREIAQGVLPFIIHRRLPSGVSEYWSAMELKIVW
jgi:DNA-directed RNA polymerase subunit K/omega|uniref:DNA-directed RNA polymerase n=1 Tax=viral metagenome TaxID=1070528 RepID=A0A6C0AI93_9ZZZZ